MQSSSLYKKSKICVFSGFFPACSGGSEYQAYLLAKVLRDYGHDVFFAGFGGHESGQYNLEGFKIYFLNTSRALRKLGDSYFLLYPQIKEIFRMERPDIVYSRSGSAIPGMLAKLSKKMGYKFIYGIAHDNRLNESFISAGFRPFNQICYFLSLYGLKNANLVIAQTKYQKQILKTKYGINGLVIRNAHPIPKDALPKPKNLPKVLFVSNYRPFKRPELFVELASYFNKGHSNCRFIMIGRKGTDRFWREKIEPAINANCNLDHLGELSQDQVNKHLNEAHLLVNTSTAEGFSNTFIQAWLRKVPVASLIVDPDHLLSKKGLGLCAGGNIMQLINNVKQLIDDQVLRESMGEKAREYAINHHAIENVGTEFCAVVESLTKQK